jgi:uncharacterized protein (UPF0548 family)
MFYLREPSVAELERVLAACAGAPLTYQAVGATRDTPPPGYHVDRYAVELGRGAEVFERARDAVRSFAMYPRPWTRVHRGFDEPHPGADFVAVIRHLGFWSANPCRIVYVTDQMDRDPGGAPVRQRYGFALGTLAGHAETGEERFEVYRDTRTDVVGYGVVAFSRPHALLARLGTPIARALQRRFGHDSRRAMVQAASGPPLPPARVA